MTSIVPSAPIDILVIDDDEPFADLTKDRLELAGYTVEVQLGPFGSINSIRRLRPRLVLLDMNMPAITGDQVLELIRDKVPRGTTKVVFFSSMDEGDLEHLAIAHGADGFLSKSASRTEILAAVQRALDA